MPYRTPVLPPTATSNDHFFGKSVLCAEPSSLRFTKKLPVARQNTSGEEGAALPPVLDGGAQITEAHAARQHPDRLG